MSEIKKCPFCREEIKQDAIKCKHCKSDLAENIDREQQLTPKRKNTLIYWLLGGALILIIVGSFIVNVFSA